MFEISTRNLLNLSQHGENRGLDQCLHAQLYCSMNARNNRRTCRKDEKERERDGFSSLLFTEESVSVGGAPYPLQETSNGGIFARSV